MISLSLYLKKSIYLGYIILCIYLHHSLEGVFKCQTNIFLSPENLREMRVAVGITVPTVPEAHIVNPLVFMTKNGGELAIMDKKLAHSLLEVMVIENSKKEKRTINQLSGEENLLYFDLLSSFIDFIHEEEVIEKYDLNDTTARIVFNHDPWTLDRDGL